MIRRFRSRLSSRSGFSLAETLLAVIILLLVSVIVANGIPTAKNVYEKVVIGANARLLLSTTVTELRNQIGTACDVKVDTSKNTITYGSGSTGSKSRIYLKQPDGAGYKVIMLQEYLADDIIGNFEGTGHLLVSDAAANKNLFVTYEEVKTDSSDEEKPENYIVISGLSVCRKSDPDSAVAGPMDVSIRIFSVN